MEALEGVRLTGYFGRVADQFRAAERPAVFLVTRLLADRPAFVRAVGSMGELRSVLPKPKSVDAGARAEVGDEYQVDVLSRELFADAERAAEFIAERAPDGPVALLDVGGYFAPCLPALADRLGGRLLGVVEDTENGHRRYADLGKWPCPVVSVARSPLKEPEDYLVGQSVVFSAEAVMRERGDILQGRAALVIGFGKLGSSIARLLHAKGVAVSVYDTDPVRRIQAASQGFHVTRDRATGLVAADVVLCATGALALRGSHFPHLRNGAYVATVTSSEDELELKGLPPFYRQTQDGHVTQYETTGHYFYLMNDGNAVNFLHGAAVGPFIFLVQGEILAALGRLASGRLESGMQELGTADRATIAVAWLDYWNR
jgi:adenosylhomocysteinase